MARLNGTELLVDAMANAAAVFASFMGLWLPVVKRGWEGFEEADVVQEIVHYHGAVGVRNVRLSSGTASH